MIAREYQGARITMQNLAKSVRLLAASAGACFALAIPAHADEGGASVYLMGTGGPGVAIQPPLEGVYLDNTFYFYRGSTEANRSLVIGGNIVANVDATITADFVTALAAPSTNFLGGTLSMGVTVPIAAPMIDASATLTGPGGGQITRNIHDAALLVGDPLAVVNLGWKSGKTHFAIQTLTNVPVGNYREGRLANIAFHRWAVDISGAGTWHDEASGWDVSAKIGYTIDGRNDATDYSSGDDFHRGGSGEDAVQGLLARRAGRLFRAGDRR